MIFNIVKMIVRQFSDEFRLKLLTVCLMESAMVRPGQEIKISLKVTPGGNHDFRVITAE